MTLENFFGKVLIPLSYYIKGDMRYTYFSQYKKNLEKNREEILKYQSDRLQSLVKHAYETVPYYKELFDKNKVRPDDIKTAADLKKIPYLTKQTIMQDPEKLKSTKKYTMKKSFSGGSTGNKVTIFKDKMYYELCAAISLRDLYSIGIRPGMKSAWVWGNEVQFKPFLKRLPEMVSFAVNRRIMFNVFKYTDDDIEKWVLKEFNRFRPEYVYGYAGIIYDIAKCIKQRSLKIPQVKFVVTTSERLEHREFIEEVFNCKVHDHYGCSEINSVAIEDKEGVMHSSDDFVIIETAEDNVILLTPLESYGMPLLRYRLGDIGFIDKKAKEDKNSPFRKFNLVVGRIYEILYNRKMEKIGGGLIKQRLEDDDVEINEFQVVQHSLDLVDLNVVDDSFTTDKGVREACAILKEVLGCKTVKVNHMLKFPAEKNGKRIAFKCEMK